MGKIIMRDESDMANITIRFKGIEIYHEYDTIRDFVNEWRDYDDYMEQEVLSLEHKTEARRQVDLFLKRIKHIPTDTTGFNSWKANNGIYKKGDEE